MAAITICSNFGAQEKKVCHCFHYFTIKLSWNDRTRCHDLSFLNVEFSTSSRKTYFCFIGYAKAFDCADHSKLRRFLKEMGIPDHLTCLLRTLYAGQEATVRTGHGTTDWLQIGKGVRQGCILSPCLFNFMQSTSWETLGWKKHKLESWLSGEISITSDMQMTPPLWQKVKRN